MRDLNRIRGSKLQDAYAEAKNEACIEFEYLRENPLFVAGLMLYWGEGDKVNKHKVRLTNTDTGLMRVFVQFLVHICKVPVSKLHPQLLIYPDLNDEEVSEFWSNEIGVPIENFNKSTEIIGKHKTKRLGTGICIVLVSNAYLKVKVIEWIRLMGKELIDDKKYESI